MMLKLRHVIVLGLLLLVLSACEKTAATEEANLEPSVQAGNGTQQSEAVALQATAPVSGAAEAGSQVGTEVGTEVGTKVDYCLNCHTDQQKLIESASPTQDATVQTADGKTIEAWEGVLVDGEKFPQSIHGLKGCLNCHGGVQSPDKAAAHVGVEPNPSVDAQTLCGACHTDIVQYNGVSLHATLGGIRHALDARSAPVNHNALEQAFNANCSECHTTCGECHVSRPSQVGGGFVNGHLFNRKPSMVENCTACHESRVGNEFLGKNEGLPADVHFSQGQMECVDCHSRQEVHGQPSQCSTCHEGPTDARLPPPDHRYAGVQAPRCETCHITESSGQDGVIMHQMHGATLSCQVCHSVAYTSCEGCHAGKPDASGKPAYTLDTSNLTFLIGRSPNQSYERPYRYVPVRHVPVSADTFAAFGENLLPNFDKVETWKYTTPHNIQRNTPQTESCNACHGNASLFLTADKVASGEIKANEDVIVQGPPPPITSSQQIP